MKAVQVLQVNHCQKHLFLDQLTDNMTKDCSLIYQFSTCKLQAQNMCTQIVFCFDIQNNLCTQLFVFMKKRDLPVLDDKPTYPYE